MTGETGAARSGVEIKVTGGRSAAARAGQGGQPTTAGVDGRAESPVRIKTASPDAAESPVRIKTADAAESHVRVEIASPDAPAVPRTSNVPVGSPHVASESTRAGIIVSSPADVSGPTGEQGSGGNNSSYDPGEEAQKEAEALEARIANIESYLRTIHDTFAAQLAEDTEQGERLAGLQDEVRDLRRVVSAIAEDLAAHRTVTSNLLAIALLREQAAQAVARDAAEHADNQMNEVLEQAFKKLGRVGDKLLALNLHLMPVKQWEIGGELSVAGVMKGTFTVTFGHE